MNAPLILALDLSKTTTGICRGRAGEVPTFESIKCRDYDDDGALAKVGCWLIEWVNANRPDAVFYEAAIQRGVYEAPILKDLVAVVRFVCKAKRIKAKPANVQSARAAFLGHGRPDRPKERARAMCRELGWAPNNLDEADAGTVWWFGGMQTAPRHIQLITPMMQAKVASQFNAPGVFAEGRA